VLLADMRLMCVGGYISRHQQSQTVFGKHMSSHVCYLLDSVLILILFFSLVFNKHI